MAVDVNATRRQRAWDSIPDGASRTWTRQFRGSTYVLTLSNPQIRALHGNLVFTVDVLVTKDGQPIYEDRLNTPNPPMGTVGADGTVTDNPRQAFREHVVDVVRAVTADFTKPHLMRGPDGRFLGDTLAVRSSTADGRITSSNASYTSTRNGSSLSARSGETTENVSCNFETTFYRIETIFLDFGTSSLGAGATVSAGTLTLYGSGTAETNTDSPTIEARSHDWGGTLSTADAIDFNPGTNWTDKAFIASMALTSWNQTSGTANNLTSQSGMTTWINKTGTSYCAVNYDQSATSTAPTGSNVFNTRMADQAGTSSDPLLTVTYTVVLNVSITSVVAAATAQGETSTPTVAPAATEATATSQGETPTPVIALDATAATVAAQGEASTPLIAVDAVVSEATAQGEAPAVSIAEDGGNVDIASEPATATSEAPVPTSSIAPDSDVATSTAAANAPTMDHTLDSSASTATADAQTPAPTIEITSSEATATSSAESPSVTIAPDATAATATAEANAPGTSIAESSVTATASSDAIAPTPTIEMVTTAATATADANVPTTIHDLASQAASAGATANAPTPQLEIQSEAATVTTEAKNPLIRIIAPAVDLVVSIAKTFLVRVGILKKHEVAVALARTYNVALDFTASDGVALEVARTYEVEIIMSNETCYVGNSITATGRFTLVSSGALTDPTTVTATVQIPGGTKTTYTYGTDSEMAKSSTGIYTCTFTPSSAGKWIVKFTGAGAVVAVNQEDFTVLTAI